ncbi:MAG: polysaccharide deacetylase family protein [Solirubrobacterales bacterium]
MRRFVAMAAAAACLLGLAGAASAADSAVVLMYRRFGDDRSPANSIRIEQFRAHLDELRQGGFTILPLPAIVDALIAGKPLPDKAVAITVDDSWTTAYRDAWPMLKAAGYPFTLFVVTDELDRGGPDTMTWDQVRELADSGLVSVGTQGASRIHMAQALQQEVAADLARARARLAAELPGRPATLFAWPYGEASLDAFKAVAAAGFTAAFGQHSGAAWSHGERWYWPRFILNETYGEPERFRLAARALPLPATEISPADPKVAANPPAFGFTLESEAPEDLGLACYTTSEGRARLERLGPRIEVRLDKPLPPGRARLNCTSPSLDGRWRWFGWQFWVP